LFLLITAPTSDRLYDLSQPGLRGGGDLSRHDVAVSAMKEQRITAGILFSDSWKCCQAIDNEIPSFFERETVGFSTVWGNQRGQNS